MLGLPSSPHAPLPSPQGQPLPIDWMLCCCGMRLSPPPMHMCSSVAPHGLQQAPRQPASLLLLAILVCQDTFSIPAPRARGPVACPAPFLNLAVPEATWQMDPPRWRSVVSPNGLRDPLWDGIPSVETLLSSHLAPGPGRYAHSAAAITRFGRRQALATKPLVPCAMSLASWRYNNSSA